MRECEPSAKRDLCADDAVPTIELMLGRKHVHRPAFTLRDAGLAPRELGHDDLGIDAVSEHVTMIAITGDHAVLIVIERGLQADRNRLLPDVEVAETSDQTEAVKLPRLLF